MDSHTLQLILVDLLRLHTPKQGPRLLSLYLMLDLLRVRRFGVISRPQVMLVLTLRSLLVAQQLRVITSHRSLKQAALDLFLLILLSVLVLVTTIRLQIQLLFSSRHQIRQPEVVLVQLTITSEISTVENTSLTELSVLMDILSNMQLEVHIQYSIVLSIQLETRQVFPHRTTCSLL